MGRASSTGGVRAHRDHIQLRFSWRGTEYRPTLPLKPTVGNLKAAARLRQQIAQEIELGVFSMQAHFPDFRSPTLLAGEQGDEIAPHERTLKQWAEVFFQIRGRTTEHSTLEIYRRHLESYWLGAWGHLKPRHISHELVQKRLAALAKGFTDKDGRVQKPLSRKSQNNILIPLRGLFRLISKILPGFKDPTEGVENLKTQAPAPDPFSLQEVELILAALRRISAEVADFYEFAFFAGLRDSEQIALLWEDVDLVNMTLAVRRARVLGQSKSRTKTHRSRIVELNVRAAAVIERQRARSQLAGQEVFLNPWTGKGWHDDQRQRVVFRQAIRACGVRYRPPKECRDTSVSLALMAGCDAAWVAAQHGHSVVTMLRSYAKWLPKGDGNRNLEKVNAVMNLSTELERFRTSV